MSSLHLRKREHNTAQHGRGEVLEGKTRQGRGVGSRWLLVLTGVEREDLSEKEELREPAAVLSAEKPAEQRARTKVVWNIPESQRCQPSGDILAILRVI